MSENDLYNELSRLNNELVTLQRELTKKNMALAAEREWFQVTLSSIGDAVIATDEHGRATFLNPVAQTLTGWQQEDAAGKPVHEVFHIINGATRRPAELPVTRVLREGVIAGLANNTVLIAKNGSEIPIDDSAAPIKDDAGHILGVVIVFRDINERRQLEEALQRANADLEQRVQQRTAALVQANSALWTEITERKRAEEKLRKSERLAVIGTTTAKLAHEIGNPLNGMYTTLQVLERFAVKQAAPRDDILASTVQDLKTETDRLRSLLHELRSFSRPYTPDRQPFFLAELVAEVLAVETPFYADQGIRVEYESSPDMPEVLGDNERLKQVVLNLCNNAAEAMSQGGILTVRGYMAREHVCLEVRDTGQGIPEDVNIFEPFATTKSEGTGLGLAIAKQIIEAHSGTITYTSAPQTGTTFLLTLPLARVDRA